MASILQKLLNRKITFINSNKNNITYSGQLPIYIKELKYNNNKEKISILNKIEKIKNEFQIEILYIEENQIIYTLFFENQELIDDIFESKGDISSQGYIENFCSPIKKREINNLFEKELSVCKIYSNKENSKVIENGIGTGFFCRLNIKQIPFNLALITNNHILDRNSIKAGKEIIFDHKDSCKSKILEISQKRRIYTDEKLDYTLVEILETDNIFENDEIEKLFKIDQNILEGNTLNMKNIDIFILQYPNGNELAYSSGKITEISSKDIYYNATTYNGSSGSPIIRRDNYCIIGLYAGHKNGKQKYVERNFGINIHAIINNIKRKIPKVEKKVIKKLNREEFIKKYKKDDHLNLIKYEAKNFVLVNSINNKFKINNIIWDKKVIKGRILPELKNFQKDFMINEGFQIYGIIENKLIGVIEGPFGTNFQNGFFLFEILIDKEYPLKFGSFYFKTKIFHPNIDESGLVSLDILSNKWTPRLTFRTVIISVQSILDSPNVDEFVNEKAAKLYKEDKFEYDDIVLEYTSKYANFIAFEEELNKYKLDIEHFEKEA